jgi:4-hydroxy-3-methylbut-2-enyl diphosphate reductase
MEIAFMVRAAMVDRYGEEKIEEHFRSFDTICHATQERQDAVLEMMKEPPDVMIVIGGYNSSNTHHLLEIALKHCPAYHIDEIGCLVSKSAIRHMPLQQERGLTETDGWLPDRRPLSIGLTAGASTPNRVIGEVIERLARMTG